MHSVVLNISDYLSTVIVVYFVVTNAMYTVLMGISLYTVILHARYSASRRHRSIADSPSTPPVALIVAAHNEENAIVDTVLSLLALDYPEKEVVVVDDGSTDGTAERLIERFGLEAMDLLYREVVPAKRPFAFYHNPRQPELLLISKPNGGKPDAINAGINMARSPYFCTVDADSIIEYDALLRLMAPVVQSEVLTVVSGGVVRIANGCRLENGRVVELDLPKTWIERCQVVEYMRTFLFGRPGWNLLNATFICSGAFCLFHRETVLQAGGFSTDTVTEDVDVIATLHRFLRKKGTKYRMVFTADPVCWTEAPHTVAMLARQRRRWQLGLTQTVMKHNDMIFNPRYGAVGMISMPFHAYIEAIGCVVEAAGTLFVPVSFLIGAMPFSLFMLILFLAIGYGTLLSMGSVLLAELNLHRYPHLRQVMILMGYAVVECVGYRQMTAFFRAQGVLKYLTGSTRWELVAHKGAVRSS
jgi:cellulose synthase/poly-beta-1,6-N-acetylglucosamine synthase-like glycosyltransferase